MRAGGRHQRACDQYGSQCDRAQDGQPAQRLCYVVGRNSGGVFRIGLIGFSAGGHLAGLAALAPGGEARAAVDFAVLGYAITSMQTETYRPARLILLGEDATPELRRATSLDAQVTRSSPPFFIWHTAEDPYVPPEHSYRLAASLAAHGVPAKPYFPAIHLMTFYRERFGHREGEFPVCEDVSARSIALPFFPAMTEGQVAQTAEALTAVLRS